MLKEILKAVQASNRKVAELEKKLLEIEPSASVIRKKVATSPEVRVSWLYWLDVTCRKLLVLCSDLLFHSDDGKKGV